MLLVPDVAVASCGQNWPQETLVPTNNPMTMGDTKKSI
jgi:hypothetical protein